MKSTKYVQDIFKVKSKCNRIIGLQKLKQAGLTIPAPIKIITPQAFLQYRKTKQINQNLKTQIISAFKEIRLKNPKRGVYAGRAYFVPTIKQPPGPRSSSVKNAKVILKEVKKLFDFAIQNKFGSKKSEIGVILYPFINPKIPFGGGSVTPSLENKNLIIIEAIFGNDEGIQSFPHDTYHVNFIKSAIVKNQITKKTHCLQVSNQLEYKTVPISKKLQNSQVLKKKDILNIARCFTKFILQHGPHRLEFATQKEGVYFRECIPFKPVKHKERKIKIKGKILKVGTSSDIKKVKKNNKIIFIAPEIIRKRNMDLLTSLAFNITHKKIILYPGSASTAHAATILRERGHILVFIGAAKFKTGQIVKISLENGKLCTKTYE